MADQTPPPNGWESPHEPPPDIDALGQLARALLEVMPPDLQARIVDAIREVLKALRALLEWWIDRLERRGANGQAAEVRDIPVL